MGLNAHWFQHAPFEGLGCIEQWLARRRATVTCSRLFEGGAPASVDWADLLIVMGGPMSVNDERRYPWLREEKRRIARAIDRGHAVLGICLGAQLIAAVLGAPVRRAESPEIGWFPIERVDGHPGTKLAASLSNALTGNLDAFHWHGETFDLPAGAEHIARSEACENQAFVLGERVAALQFHLEMTLASASALVESCGEDLVPGRFVQSADSILGNEEKFLRINAAMDAVLGTITGT